MAKALRPFAVLVSAGWLALCGLMLVLLWFPSRIVSVDASDLALTVDADAYGTARVVATAVTAVAGLLALPLLFAALRSPARRRPVTERVSPVQTTERVEAPRVRADLATERGAAATAPADELETMRRRVEAHDDELRRLREQLHTGAQPPAAYQTHDAHEHVPNGSRP